MPLPKFSSRYPDVREVFDYAIAQGGARYTLDSPGQAKHWRSRAYAFRKVLWEELNPNGGNSPTPYDALKITLNGATCIVSVETASGRGVLEPLQGSEPLQQIDPVLKRKAKDELDREFEAEAEDLAKRLGLEL